MAELSEIAPAAWPTSSELAEIVKMSISGFGRYVRSHAPEAIRVIGRDKRVAPPEAIALLVERGLPKTVAQREVMRLVQLRMAAMPVLRREWSDPTSPNASDAALLDELHRHYESMIDRMRKPDFDSKMRALFSSGRLEHLAVGASGPRASRGHLAKR